MISEVKRPNCQFPTDCLAKGNGHCRKCHMAATARKLHADPEFAAARDARGAERMRKLHADPEFAAAHAERMRKLNADPEFAAANAERMRKLNADPEFAAAKKSGKRGGIVVPPEKEADWQVMKKAGYSAAEAAKAMGLKPS